MEIREICKSQLLKNVRIEERDKGPGITKLSDNERPIEVIDVDGEYYIKEGVERVLNANKNLAGDDKIKCHVTVGTLE